MFQLEQTILFPNIDNWLAGKFCELWTKWEWVIREHQTQEQKLCTSSKGAVYIETDSQTFTDI